MWFGDIWERLLKPIHSLLSSNIFFDKVKYTFSLCLWVLYEEPLPFLRYQSLEHTAINMMTNLTAVLHQEQVSMPEWSQGCPATSALYQALQSNSWHIWSLAKSRQLYKNKSCHCSVFLLSNIRYPHAKRKEIFSLANLHHQTENMNLSKIAISNHTKYEVL